MDFDGDDIEINIFYLSKIERCYSLECFWLLMLI